MASRARMWAFSFAVLAASILLTVLLWPRAGVLFLFFPLVLPFVRRTPAPRTGVCRTCGWSTSDGSFAFCPRDGTKL